MCMAEIDGRSRGQSRPAAVTLAADYADTHGYASQRVAFELFSQGTPVLVALVLRTSSCGGSHGYTAATLLRTRICNSRSTTNGKSQPRGRRLFTVSFAQHAPSISAGIQLSLEADTVDGDPRDEGLFHFERHASVERCSVVQIADVARWGVIAEVFVIAKHDTTRSHGRWSVRRQMARDLPDAYQFLLTGRTSGDL